MKRDIAKCTRYFCFIKRVTFYHEEGGKKSHWRGEEAASRPRKKRKRTERERKKKGKRREKKNRSGVCCSFF